MFSKKEKDYTIVDTLSSLLGQGNVPDDCKAHIQDAILSYDKYYNDKYIVISKLMGEWSTRLGKYYKLERDEGKYYRDILYVYPYRILASNHTLWWLVVDYNSNYDGGVTDIGIDFEDMDDSYTITEITKDEFLQKAIENVKRVVERRFTQRKAKENV